MSDGLNTDGLDKLLKALSGKLPKVKVGILGGKNARTGKVPSNAMVGAAHEFGSPARNLPQRSFLRMPITTQFKKYFKNAGLLEKETVERIMRVGDILGLLERIGILGETIVQDAFDSNGFGQWKPLSPGYENNTGNTLVDTTQLRNSITSRVD